MSIYYHKNKLFLDYPSSCFPVSLCPLTVSIPERIIYICHLFLLASSYLFFSSLQSSFHTHQSMETTLVKISRDLYVAKSNDHIFVLILLALSLAFEIDDHSLFLWNISSFGFVNTIFLLIFISQCPLPDLYILELPILCIEPSLLSWKSPSKTPSMVYQFP